MGDILHLNLHREFFAAIAAGEKRISIGNNRLIGAKRIENRQYDAILFRNGYSKDTLRNADRISRVASLRQQAQCLLRHPSRQDLTHQALGQESQNRSYAKGSLRLFECFGMLNLLSFSEQARCSRLCLKLSDV